MPGRLIKAVVQKYRLPTYKVLRRKYSVLQPFGVMMLPALKAETVTSKLSPLFGALKPGKRSGSELAMINIEPMSGESIAAIIAMGEAMKKDQLTEARRKDGYHALLGVADDLDDGHLYLHIDEQPLSSNALVLFRPESAFKLQPHKYAEAVFSAFPGSANISDDLGALHRVQFRLSSGELEPFHGSDPDSTTAVIESKPIPAAEFELGYGNIVEITGAQSLAQSLLLDQQFAWSWLNSTTWRHALDGRVIFTLVLSPTEKKLKLYALGFGKHPLKPADMINAHMGSAIFATMLETFVAAVEKYAQTSGATTFDDAALEAITRSLVKDEVVPMGSVLYMKHLLFEALNLPGVLLLQWPRMVVGGGTVSAPTGSSQPSK